MASPNIASNLSLSSRISFLLISFRAVFEA